MVGDTMRRYFTVIFLLYLSVWVTNTVTAQGSLLWEINSTSNTVYLLGSIHLATADFYPLNEKIEQAFNRSDILVVEVNINQVDQAQLEEMMMEKGSYSEGDSLAMHICAHTYELVEKELQGLGLDIAQFAKHKPWFLAQAISVSELQRLGFDPLSGIDKYFLDRAEGKKAIVELESFDFQIKLFDNFSDYYQELLLFYAIVDLDTIEEEMRTLISAWACGDVEGLESIVSRPLLKYPQLGPIYEKLIYERNTNMLRNIEQYLTATEDYFIVIGAAHLVGEKGIIKLLKERGYSLRQL